MNDSTRLGRSGIRAAEVGRAWEAGLARPSGPAFRRVGASVFGAHIFLGLLALTMAPLVDPNEWWWLAPFCMGSLAMLGYLVLQALRTEPAGIMYETGVFLSISCGVYYAFGPLLYVIGPVEAADYSRSWYWVDASQSVWLTGLNFVGLGLAGVAYVSARFPSLAGIAAETANRWARISPVRVFVVFLLLGFIAKYLFVLPFELRLIESVPSAGIRGLGRLLTVALLLGWSYKDRGSWWVGSLARLLLVGEMVTGALMFNKTEVLVAVMAAGLGHYFAHRRLGKLLVLALAGLLLYVLIGPIVTFGRNELVYRGGGAPAPAHLSARFDIASAYFTGGESHLAERELSGSWWSRFNYLPSQQAAVDFYDQGRGSDDLERLMWIFVPRLLFPSKPEMTGTGVDLTEKVTGFRNSSTGVGVFADGYYIFGWLGVILVSLTYGFALSAYSAIARSVVRSRAAVMYPLAFMGLYAGLRADGWWLTDVAGPMVFALVLLALFRVFSKR